MRSRRSVRCRSSSAGTAASCWLVGFSMTQRTCSTVGHAEEEGVGLSGADDVVVGMVGALRHIINPPQFRISQLKRRRSREGGLWKELESAGSGRRGSYGLFWARGGARFGSLSGRVEACCSTQPHDSSKDGRWSLAREDSWHTYARGGPWLAISHVVEDGFGRCTGRRA